MTGRDRPDRSDAWWRDAVIYQVYVRSFADANGDGEGDLAGVRSRLGHLVRLGVDAVWLTPFYPSPMADGGYDVADYRDVDPRFGTLEDFDGLLAVAQALGLKVLIDVVPNHTSSEHRWFQQALAAGPDSPERARYVFRPGAGADGERPPSDWRSIFGGPAWTRVEDGEWYLHLFDHRQPDLNWDNPQVRAEFEAILRFWLDRGVDGFRIDVAHGLAKDLAHPLRDLGETASPVMIVGGPDHPYWDRDDVHDIYRSWRRLLDAYTPARIGVAEAWISSPARRGAYVRPDELHQAFNFGFLMAPWQPEALREVIEGSLEASATVGATTTWVLSNHDVVRAATRYAPYDARVGLRRARAAALLMLALPGSAYLYQGEELGLPEVLDLPAEARQDPVWTRSGHTEPGRDGSRVPIPWERTGPSHGFGPGGSWLPQPHDWGQHAVAAQDGVAGSTLELYRDALTLRRRYGGDGPLHWRSAPTAPVLAFARESGLTCVVNLGTAPARLPAGAVLLTSAPLVGGRLPVDAAAWLISSE